MAPFARRSATMWVALAVVGCAAGLAAGCRDTFPPLDPGGSNNGFAGTAGRTYPLEDRDWSLISFVDASGNRRLVDSNARVFMRLAGGGLSGYTGCSPLKGTYSLDTATARLQFAAGVYAAGMVCVDTQYESGYLGALNAARGYSMPDSTRLVINYDANLKLEFELRR